MRQILKSKGFTRAMCMLIVCIMLFCCLPGCAMAEESKAQFSKAEDFEGKRVAVLTGSIGELFMRETVDNVIYCHYEDIAAMQEALRRGYVDGIVDDDILINILSLRQEGIVAVPLDIKTGDYAFMLKKNGPYTQKINDALQSLFDDGTVDALKDKWIYGDESGRQIDYSKYDFSDRGNGVLRVDCCAESEPMCYIGGEDSRLQGFEIELLYIVADRINMGLNITQSMFASILSSVESGKADVALSCITITPERQEMFDFSLPYYEGKLAAAYRIEDAAVDGNSDTPVRFSSLEDFNNTALAMLSATNADKLTDEVLDNVQYRRYDDISSMVAALEKGDVIGVLIDEPNGRLIANSRSGLAIFPQAISEYQYGCILQKDGLYTEEFNNALRQMAEEGILDELKEKWFSADDSRRFIDYSQYNLADRGQGVLRVNALAEVEPMLYVGGDEGQLQGFEMELIYIVADRMNMGVETQQSKFNGILPSLETGKADIGAGAITITEERKESFDFSDPYYDGGLVVMCRSEDIFSAPEDFQLDSPSVTIAVEATTAMEAAVISEYPNAKLMHVNSFSEGMLAISTGKADATAATYDAFLSMQKEKAADYRLHSDGFIGKPGECAAGISPKTKIPNAKALVDAFINEIEANGTLDDMKQRWIIDENYTMPEIARAEQPEMKIVFGTTGLCPPFSFYQDNGLTGFEIELIQRFALWCNADYEIDAYDWNGILPACISGTIDYAFTNLIITEERKEVVEFSTPYQMMQTVIVLHNEEKSAFKDAFNDFVSSFEKTFIRENRWRLILNGFMVTIKIALLSGIFGTVLGFGFCMLTRSKNKFVSKLSQGFAYVVTGIPSLVILMLIYFIVFASVDIDPVLVGIIAFSLMFMLSVAGLLNTGINAVDAGQSEAAAALGFGKVRSFFLIVMPQATRHVLPLYKGEFGSMLRLTSIVGYISIEDLTKAGDIIRSRTYEAFFPLISTAFIYFITSSAVAALLGIIERKINPKFRPRRLPSGVTEIQTIPPLTHGKKDSSPDELIRIEHLKKAYADATPLQDICTSVRRGDVITIIGPSGTGKSTLLRCINRLATPTEGSIFVFGEDVCLKKTDLNSVRRRMGMVFQSFNLFNHLTVLENIMLAPTILNKQPKQEAYEHAMQLLQSVGMADTALRYPDELSGGQRQRVAIARALAMNPEILLLDEPTSALDPTMVGEVLSVVRRLAADGMTMIIVTHEMKFARDVSTRIFYVDKGVIYEDGAPEQIFDAPKRNRTRVFVQKLKVLELEIANDKYDFIGMNEKLRSFGEKHYLPSERIEAIQRAFEELCAQNILPNKAEDKKLTVLVEYSEAENGIDMRFIWKGEGYNPMTQGDELSIRLVKHYLHSFEYSYENEQNLLVVHF